MILKTLRLGSWTEEKAVYNQVLLEEAINGTTPDDGTRGLALGYQQSAGQLVQLPAGDIPCLQLSIRRAVTLQGHGPGNTRLVLPAEEAHGVVCQYNAGDFGAGAYDSGQGATIQGLTVIRDPERVGAVTTGQGHGIVSAARVQLQDLHVVGFAGDGVRIEANVPTGEASCTQLQNVRVHGCGSWGLSIRGGDVNVCTAINVSVTASRGGIEFEPQLGGTAIGCHVNNGSYPDLDARWPAYKAQNDGSPVVFLGCYAEGDTPQPIGCDDALFVNCHFGSGMHPDSQAQEISGTTFRRLAMMTPFGWLGAGGDKSLIAMPGMQATYGLVPRFGTWANQPGAANWLDIGSTDGAEFQMAIALPGAVVPSDDVHPTRPVPPGALWVDRLLLGEPGYQRRGGGRALTTSNGYPSKGAWQVGDVALNATPAEAGPTAFAWICVRGGDFDGPSAPLFRTVLVS